MKNGFEISEDTYAFYREGNELVEVAHCHPDFYCTRVDGVYRAPLPPLSDREFVSFRNAEDALIDRIDGNVVTDEEIEADGYDDLFDLDIEDDQEHTAAWLESIEHAAEDFASGKTRRKATPEATVQVINSRPAFKAEPVDIDERLPVAISPRRAVLAGPKVVLKETGPDRHTWKDNTTNGRQFLRHS
ncbi:MAG TPA: hypothetical protein VL500_03310 [Candidatus Eisenbacteria bacterium]|jgi:hypothetical protein|nr:hypothetical protein [Candidatus Eisenbacteria bacterium]